MEDRQNSKIMHNSNNKARSVNPDAVAPPYSGL